MSNIPSNPPSTMVQVPASGLAGEPTQKPVGDAFDDKVKAMVKSLIQNIEKEQGSHKGRPAAPILTASLSSKELNDLAAQSADGRLTPKEQMDIALQKVSAKLRDNPVPMSPADFTRDLPLLRMSLADVLVQNGMHVEQARSFAGELLSSRHPLQMDVADELISRLADRAKPSIQKYEKAFAPMPQAQALELALPGGFAFEGKGLRDGQIQIAQAVAKKIVGPGDEAELKGRLLDAYIGTLAKYKQFLPEVMDKDSLLAIADKASLPDELKQACKNLVDSRNIDVVDALDDAFAPSVAKDGKFSKKDLETLEYRWLLHQPASRAQIAKSIADMLSDPAVASRVAKDGKLTQDSLRDLSMDTSKVQNVQARIALAKLAENPELRHEMAGYSDVDRFNAETTIPMGLSRGFAPQYIVDRDLGTITADDAKAYAADYEAEDKLAAWDQVLPSEAKGVTEDRCIAGLQALKGGFVFGSKKDIGDAFDTLKQEADSPERTAGLKALAYLYSHDALYQQIDSRVPGDADGVINTADLTAFADGLKANRQTTLLDQLAGLKS